MFRNSVLFKAVSGLVLCLGHKDVLQTVLYLSREATVMLPGLVLLVSTAHPLILYIDRIEAFEDKQCT